MLGQIQPIKFILMIHEQPDHRVDQKQKYGAILPVSIQLENMNRSRRSLLATVAVFALSLIVSSFTTARADTASTRPAAIYIIRHAEKPEGKEDPDLTPKGYDRANALVQVIPNNFCIPDFIFAAAPSAHSNRPIETVTPLSKALGIKILDPYGDKDYTSLVHDLMTDPKYIGKTILICWHHSEIPYLAQALGATGVPPAWPDNTFDRVWVLKYSGDSVSFQDLPQRALASDSRE
jgi:phosphohistidine phosphatase SixA